MAVLLELLLLLRLLLLLLLLQRTNNSISKHQTRDGLPDCQLTELNCTETLTLRTGRRV